MPGSSSPHHSPVRPARLREALAGQRLESGSGHPQETGWWGGTRGRQKEVAFQIIRGCKVGETVGGHKAFPSSCFWASQRSLVGHPREQDAGLDGPWG